MTKWVAVACLVVAACSGDVTVPTAVEPTAKVEVAPAAALPDPPATYDVRWERGAAWAVTNNTSEALWYTAQWTDFDNQSLVRGKVDMVAAPGTVSHGSFDRGCVQVDLVSGKVFAFAYFDNAGQPTSPQRATESCAPKPSPTPPPCPEDWPPSQCPQ